LAALAAHAPSRVATQHRRPCAAPRNASGRLGGRGHRAGRTAWRMAGDAPAADV